MKIQPAVNAFVGPFLLLYRAGTDQAERPPLELKRVIFAERHGIWQRFRLADDRIALGAVFAKGGVQAMLDEANG